MDCPPGRRLSRAKSARQKIFSNSLNISRIAGLNSIEYGLRQARTEGLYH